MNKYQQAIGRLNYFLFLSVVALLPAPQICLRYACVAWMFTWFLEGRWLSIPSSLKKNKMAIPFILFGLWYGWKLLSGLWAADTELWRWEMERYMTFGLLIPIGIWGVNKYFDWRTAGKVLVISCVAAVPLYVCWMALLFFNADWVSHLHLTEEWIQHEEWWTFLSDNISHFKHRLFLCSVEIFGAVIAFQLYGKRLAILIPSVVIMLSTIFLTGSRQAILSCAAVMVAIAIYSLPKRYRLRYGLGILLLGMVIGGGLLKLHPRMQQFELSDITEMREMSYYHDVRFNIWGAALQHPEDYLWHGLGAGQSSQYLVERYQDAGFDYYAMKHYHPHNQYLEETMEIGIFGLVLFILAWISIPLCARQTGRRTGLIITTLFMMNMLTDCMFGKFDGIVLWAIGLLFVFLQTNTKSDKQSARDAQAH